MADNRLTAAALFSTDTVLPFNVPLTMNITNPSSDCDVGMSRIVRIFSHSAGLVTGAAQVSSNSFGR